MGSVAPPLEPQALSCATLRARHLDGAPWVLELSGEADIASLDLLRYELALLAVRHREGVVIDVARLTFCDVASAHLLLTARRRLPVTLRGATGTVQRVLDLVEALRVQRMSAYCSLSHLW